MKKKKKKNNKNERKKKICEKDILILLYNEI